MIHIGEKLYSCTFCSKKFRLKEEMKKHERVHTDEKPYPCKYCNKKFSMMESVNGHVYIDGEENLKSHVNQFIKEINLTNVTYVVNNFNSSLLRNNILNQFIKKMNPSSVIFVTPVFYRNIS